MKNRNLKGHEIVRRFMSKKAGRNFKKELQKQEGLLELQYILNKTFKHPQHMLLQSFRWVGSDKGDDYWLNVYNLIYKKSKFVTKYINYVN